MARSDLSDADVAGAVGVRAETVTRWRTGRVQRPRSRESVLGVAAYLDLTAAERDTLLAAAGYDVENETTSHQEVAGKGLRTETGAPSGIEPDDRPQEPNDDPAGNVPAAVRGAEPAAGTTPAIDVTLPLAAAQTLPVDVPAVVLPPAHATHSALVQTESEEGSSPALDAGELTEMANPLVPTEVPDQRPLSVPKWLLGSVLAAVALAFLILLWSMRPAEEPAAQATPPDPLVAQPGETLLLVAAFAGDDDGQDANIAATLHEALAGEINQLSMTSTRVARWPEVVENARSADAALAESGAAGLIWGGAAEGSTRVRFTQPGADEGPGWIALLSTSDDFAPLVRADQPREAQLLALTALGQLYRQREEYEPAQAAFTRALNLQPSHPQTEALLHFLLATALERSTPPALTGAIAEYGRAIPLRPDWANARYNRGSAYLERYFAGGEPDLLDAAIADFSWVIAAAPAFGDAFLKRGIARYERNRPGDLEPAYADMTSALARSPNSDAVYFNRGLLSIRRGDDQWRYDLARALDRTPDSAAVHAALCRGRLMENEPINALKACNRAQALEPSIPVHGAKGITYALLGRSDDAVEELNAYLAWLDDLPRTAHAPYNRAQVQAWIDTLQAGEMPFDAGTLSNLRN